MHLQQNGYYEEALDWFRRVFDYSNSTNGTPVYPPFNSATHYENVSYSRSLDAWLENPLDVHLIASSNSRYPVADLRFVMLSLVRCLLEYADDEFTIDSPESLPKARGLYELALRLLSHDIFPKAEETFVGELELRANKRISHTSSAMDNDRSASTKAPATIKELINKEVQLKQSHYLQLVNNLPFTQAAQKRETSNFRLNFLPQVHFNIPQNPIPMVLRLRAELNLHKIRTGRNIAGIERDVVIDTNSQDITGSIPSIIGGRLSIPSSTSIRPTQYRYKVLIERAKHLVDLARQLEATYLSLWEKFDQENYNIYKARQQLEVARQGSKLQNLRLGEANHSISLAQEQLRRTNLTFTHYDNLINESLLEYEESALMLLRIAGIAQGAAMIGGAVAGGIVGWMGGPGGSTVGAMAGFLTGAVQSGGAALATFSSRDSMLASFERREQEWKFQKALAEKDQAIAGVQQLLANDRYKIVEQEKFIADLTIDQAADSVAYLQNEFTNPDLYRWMIQIIGDVYGYFLQQATTMAKTAENQLAFEQQEPPQSLVLGDYWEPPSENAVANLSSDSEETDRRGLTGSARLLQDIYRLDQYAFETDKRKLQLSKTISLVMLDPLAFARFRETGVLVFHTSTYRFDRDFPGHYLRLVKRIRTSVIALIPPVEGIRATLTSLGISRTVIGGDLFQETVIRRDPELVALTSPQNATGLFELQQDSDKLYPFEGSGVDMGWEFRMPKASNPIDYNTIADIFVTIDYTALHSYDYQQKVIKELDRSISAERPFSLRHEFADAWYELHNPDLAKDAPMQVSFSTTLADFPPNINDLAIEHVTLYLQRNDEVTQEIEIEQSHFQETGSAGIVGGAATTVNGLASTRRSNASSWFAMLGKSPAGEWTLALEDVMAVRNLFKQELIEDILFVITFGGITPEWPN